MRSVGGWRDTRLGDIQEVQRGAPFTLSRSHLDRGPIARLICASSTLRDALYDDARDGAVLHSHGLWLMPNVYPGWAARSKNSKARFILSPRGMLGDAALAFSRTSKLAFWSLLQRSALASASALHATSDAEVNEIRAFGLMHPVAMIPNGVDVPSEGPAAAPRRPELLYLGRLHPKKGINKLIQAWAQIGQHRPEWSLRIVGPSEVGYADQLRACTREYSAPRVLIEGPAYGAERAVCYSRASIFVLPTLNENFAMVVAEALATGIPVIATKGAPWAGLETEGCGWWVDHGVAALAEALEKATMLPPDVLASMGARGRAWMQRDFSWRRVAADMQAVYRWAQHGGPPPPSIRFA